MWMPYLYQMLMFVKRASFLFLICSFSIVIAAEELSKVEFAQQALSFKQNSQKEATHVLEDDLSITSSFPDGSQHFAYLNNAYATYLKNPSSLNDIFEKFLGLKELEVYSETSTEAKLAALMPVLKNDAYIADVKAAILNQDPSATFPLFYQTLHNGLNLLYAFDTQESMRFLSTKDLEGLGLSREQVKNRAVKNLRQAIPQIGVAGDVSFVSYLIADENYESSLLLVDSLWTKDNFPVKGEIVVLAMSRSLVMITGSADKEGIATIINFANTPDNNISHALATTFLIRRENKWEIFEPSF